MEQLIMAKLNTFIGLEVHVELSTKSKMFCRCSADHFSVKPNTNTCPTCLGLPGALPFANKQAVDDVVKFGLALNCNINKFSKFDRKHYFYPDLPKAYQISQYDLPFCEGGHWISSMGKKFGITRVHLEEDTAKMVHSKLNGQSVSLVDFNRSSVPLMEMVTEPDFRSTDEVMEFLKDVQLIVRYLGISTADMEKGSMRLEANLSVGEGDQLPDYKIELKNINSFRYLEKAMDFEIKRQSIIVKSGAVPDQETRGYDEEKQVTFTQRSKEEAKDYRYFPEPDLPPVELTDEEIKKLKNSLPILPVERRKKYKDEFSLKNQYIEVLIASKEISDYFEKCIELAKKHEIEVADLVNIIVNKKMYEKYSEPAALIRKIVEINKKDYASEEETKEAALEVVKEEKDAVERYRSGKEQIIGFLIGKVQSKLKGQGEPKIVINELQKVLIRR